MMELLTQAMPAAAIDRDEHTHTRVAPHRGQHILQQRAVGSMPGPPGGRAANPALKHADRVADMPERARVDRAWPVRPALKPAQQALEPPQDGTPWTSNLLILQYRRLASRCALYRNNHDVGARSQRDERLAILKWHSAQIAR